MASSSSRRNAPGVLKNSDKENRMPSTMTGAATTTTTTSFSTTSRRVTFQNEEDRKQELEIWRQEQQEFRLVLVQRELLRAKQQQQEEASIRRRLRGAAAAPSSKMVAWFIVLFLALIPLLSHYHEPPGGTGSLPVSISRGAVVTAKVTSLSTTLTSTTATTTDDPENNETTNNPSSNKGSSTSNNIPSISKAATGVAETLSSLSSSFSGSSTTSKESAVVSESSTTNNNNSPVSSSSVASGVDQTFVVSVSHVNYDIIPSPKSLVLKRVTDAAATSSASASVVEAQAENTASVSSSTTTTTTALSDTSSSSTRCISVSQNSAPTEEFRLLQAHPQWTLQLETCGTSTSSSSLSSLSSSLMIGDFGSGWDRDFLAAAIIRRNNNHNEHEANNLPENTDVVAVALNLDDDWAVGVCSTAQFSTMPLDFVQAPWNDILTDNNENNNNLIAGQENGSAGNFDTAQLQQQQQQGRATGIWQQLWSSSSKKTVNTLSYHVELLSFSTSHCCGTGAGGSTTSVANNDSSSTTTTTKTISTNSEGATAASWISSSRSKFASILYSSTPLDKKKLPSFRDHSLPPFPVSRMEAPISSTASTDESSNNIKAQNGESTMRNIAGKAPEEDPTVCFFGWDISFGEMDRFFHYFGMIDPEGTAQEDEYKRTARKKKRRFRLRGGRLPKLLRNKQQQKAAGSSNDNNDVDGENTVSTLLSQTLSLANIPRFLRELRDRHGSILDRAAASNNSSISNNNNNNNQQSSSKSSNIVLVVGSSVHDVWSLTGNNKDEIVQTQIAQKETDSSPDDSGTTEDKNEQPAGPTPTNDSSNNDSQARSSFWGQGQRFRVLSRLLADDSADLALQEPGAAPPPPPPESLSSFLVGAKPKESVQDQQAPPAAAVGDPPPPPAMTLEEDHLAACELLVRRLSELYPHVKLVWRMPLFVPGINKKLATRLAQAERLRLESAFPKNSNAMPIIDVWDLHSSSYISWVTQQFLSKYQATTTTVDTNNDEKQDGMMKDDGFLLYSPGFYEDVAQTALDAYRRRRR